MALRFMVVNPLTAGARGSSGKSHAGAASGMPTGPGQLPEDYGLSQIRRNRPAALRGERDASHPALMAVELMHEAAALDVPQPHRLVHAAGQDAPAVR